MESNEPITNESKSLSISDLKSFTIRGLFGYKDIVLPLDKEVLILIAENGAGKTNILKILYQVLSREIDEINSLNYNSICIEFSNNKKYEVDFPDSITIVDSDYEITIIQTILEKEGLPKKEAKNFLEYMKNEQPYKHKSLIKSLINVSQRRDEIKKKY